MQKLKDARIARDLDTPVDLPNDATRAVSAVLNRLVADSLVLYIKTKNFHWHVSGRHFRDYHLMFDEQAEQIFATIDDLAERVRKIGGTTIRSLGQVTKLATIAENDDAFVEPHAMMAELIRDHRAFVTSLRGAHKIAEDNDDVATTSLLENIIDGAERRLWFLFETSRRPD
ncbi:MAG: DNA starvation/stationary phase protection protein [Xanthobacteraceae bacterium]|nr:DNA starvation/stationary phase protection protein [Xanthobacteraceae bacterium]